MKTLQKSNKKELIIDTAAKLFMVQGYKGTSVNEIIREMEISKGSFYFHFNSKKELALEVSKHYKRETLSNFYSAKEENSWKRFSQNLIGSLINKAKKDKIFGCPMAIMGMETVIEEPEISNLNYDFCKEISNIFYQVLIEEGLKETEAKEKSKTALSMYQGSLLLYRMSLGDINILKKLLRDFLTLA